jgi:hypothetical protein
MKGTEGIDYVITQCGHCEGSGKCRCYNCLCATAIDVIHEDDKHMYDIDDRDDKIKELEDNGFMVRCNICKGVGKVVFWRE